jgi:hypothetical protein
MRKHLLNVFTLGALERIDPSSAAQDIGFDLFKAAAFCFHGFLFS